MDYQLMNNIIAEIDVIKLVCSEIFEMRKEELINFD